MTGIVVLNSMSGLNKQIALFQTRVQKMWEEWIMPTTADILCAVAFFSILDEVPVQLKDGLSEKDYLYLKKVLKVYFNDGRNEVSRLIDACEARSTQIGKKAHAVQRQVHSLISALTFEQYCDLLINVGKVKDEEGLVLIATVLRGN